MDEQELESVPRGAPHPLRSSTRCHTHSSHGEKTHARLIPAAPAHYFLAVILWIQVKVSRCLHSPKQLTSVSSSRLNIFGSILPFVPGQIWRQIGILQNNQRPACDECEASIVRYLLSNQLGIWGGAFSQELVFARCFRSPVTTHLVIVSQQTWIAMLTHSLQSSENASFFLNPVLKLGRIHRYSWLYQ